MASDLLLPGLAARILTLPYNPNNVSEDAAPVTVGWRSKSACNWQACSAMSATTRNAPIALSTT